MKKTLLLLALLAGAFVAEAQKVYFIYVQSDNGAPFYVRIGSKVHSSTASGYTIIPGLIDSSYQLQVGFPGQTSESRFPVALNKEDKGYVLKQVGGTWNLFDLQALTLIKALAAAGPSEAENQQMLAAADPFMRLLVQYSDDMTLLHSGPSAPAPAMLAVAETPAPEKAAAASTVEMKPVAVNSTNTVMAAGAQLAAQTVLRQDTLPVPAEPVYARSVVTRRSESSTTEGFGLVFLDKQGELTDTIRLLIPNPKAGLAPAPEATPVKAVETRETRDTVLAKPDAEASIKGDAGVAKPEKTVAVASDTAAKAMVPADCKSVADENDFYKLRKSMAAAADEGAMVTTARKGFKGRCYTTEQVRNLSTLFLTALGKYNFFEAAKGHVSDPERFATLGTELKDEYFSKRFSTLLQ